MLLDQSVALHLPVAQTVGLVIASLLLLPFSLYSVLLCYALRVLLPLTGKRSEARKAPAFRPQTVLVTGVGTTQGLELARMFHIAGHNVIGADFEPGRLAVHSRFSTSLKRFYALPEVEKEGDPFAYMGQVLSVLQKEKVQVWISCTGSTTTQADGRIEEIVSRNSDCRLIQFEPEMMSTMSGRQGRLQYTHKLGLQVPDSHFVRSREEAHRMLRQLHADTGSSYIMKSAKARTPIENARPLLPGRTVSETYGFMSTVPVSAAQPYILQEFIHGKEYSTQTLIVGKKVQTFVAYESSNPAQLEALPADSPLGQSMLRFSEEFATRCPNKLTGHLAFKFVVTPRSSAMGAGYILFAIDCSPYVQPGIILFHGNERELASRYLRASAVPVATNGVALPQDQVLVPSKPPKYYWIGHDLAALVLHPLLLLVGRNIGLAEALEKLSTFAQHLLSWKEATFEVWDPLPWFWLYHVYWPVKLIKDSEAWGRWGSRLESGVHESAPPSLQVQKKRAAAAS